MLPLFLMSDSLLFSPAVSPAFLGNVGGSELLLIMVLVLLVFGPKQLPEVAKTLGKTLKGVRKAADELRQEVGMDEALKETRQLGNDLARSVKASIDQPLPSAQRLPPASDQTTRPQPSETPADPAALPISGNLAPDSVASTSASAAAEDPPVERRSPKPRPGAQPPVATLTDSSPSDREPS